MVTLKRFIILTAIGGVDLAGTRINGHFLKRNKKPAEAGFFKTILTSCQKPPRQWSIIHDPEHVLRFS
jgi:hypothetical protein